MMRLYKISFSLMLLGLFSASINAAEKQQTSNNTKFFADARVGFFENFREDRNGSEITTNTLRVRLRAGALVPLNTQWSFKTRFAGRYSDQNNEIRHTKFFKTKTAGDGLKLGEGTLDTISMLYKEGSHNLVLGRFQTTFELDGVGKKSLDRNTSPNTDITWVDGAYYRFAASNKWKHHAIAQYNNKEGSSEVRRGPLDYTPSSSRVSYFYSFDRKDKGAQLPRMGVDLNYMPDALCKDGTSNCAQREDYIAVVGRLVAQWKMNEAARRFMLSAELGYAPNTPLNTTMNTGTTGDSDGFARHITANIINLFQDHSIGLIYGEVDPGYLISPDFRNNNTLLEVRYKWQVNKKQKFEARLRQREDLIVLTGSTKSRVDTDFYLRYSYKF